MEETVCGGADTADTRTKAEYEMICEQYTQRTSWLYHTLIVLSIITMILLILTSLTGCGHNTGTFLMGTEAKLGFDTQNAIPSIVYIDGFTATDVSRENSGWEVEIDAASGITREKDGSVKGIKRIKRYVGPQCNGYLVDLAKDNPRLADEYLKAVQAFWSNNKEVK